MKKKPLTVFVEFPSKANKENVSSKVYNNGTSLSDGDHDKVGV